MAPRADTSRVADTPGTSLDRGLAVGHRAAGAGGAPGGPYGSLDCPRTTAVGGIGAGSRAGPGGSAADDAGRAKHEQVELFSTPPCRCRTDSPRGCNTLSRGGLGTRSPGKTRSTTGGGPIADDAGDDRSRGDIGRRLCSAPGSPCTSTPSWRSSVPVAGVAGQARADAPGVGVQEVGVLHAAVREHGNGGAAVARAAVVRPGPGLPGPGDATLASTCRPRRHGLSAACRRWPRSQLHGYLGAQAVYHLASQAGFTPAAAAQQHRFIGGRFGDGDSNVPPEFRLVSVQHREALAKALTVEVVGEIAGRHGLPWWQGREGGGLGDP